MKFRPVLVERESENLPLEQSVSDGVHFPRLLASDHENVRPDILVLGKALAGGFYPVGFSSRSPSLTSRVLSRSQLF